MPQRISRRSHIGVCSECKVIFQTARAHAETCSPKCRKRRQRRLEMSRAAGLKVLIEKVAAREGENEA